MEGEANNQPAQTPIPASIVTDEDREAVDNLRMVLIFAAEAMNACAARGIAVKINMNRAPDGHFFPEIDAQRQERVILPPVDLSQDVPANDPVPEQPAAGKATVN